MQDEQRPRSHITVVIPAYNAARYLPETVESVRSQTIQDWELIVVDNGSTDSTAALVAEISAADPRVRLVRLPENVGPARARNEGFASASAESGFITFLDADDVWLPDALEVLSAALRASPWALAAHGTAQQMDAEGHWFGQPIGYPCPPPAHNGHANGACAHTTLLSLAPLNWICTAGLVLVRREALESLPAMWDPATTPADDWDLWLRLLAHGDFAFTERVVLLHRRHATSLTGDRLRLRSAETSVRQRVLHSTVGTPLELSVRDALRKGDIWLARRRLEYAGGHLRAGRFVPAAKDVARFGVGYLKAKL